MNNANSNHSLNDCHGNHVDEADASGDAGVAFTDIELKTMSTPKGFVRFENEEPSVATKIDLSFVDEFSR